MSRKYEVTWTCDVCGAVEKKPNSNVPPDFWKPAWLKTTGHLVDYRSIGFLVCGDCSRDTPGFFKRLWSLTFKRNEIQGE